MSELWVDRLGWTLVHFLWEGAIIALVFACARQVLRSAAARYVAGGAAMLAMVLAVYATFAVQQPNHSHAMASVPAPTAFQLPCRRSKAMLWCSRYTA